MARTEAAGPPFLPLASSVNLLLRVASSIQRPLTFMEKVPDEARKTVKCGRPLSPALCPEHGPRTRGHCTGHPPPHHRSCHGGQRRGSVFKSSRLRHEEVRRRRRSAWSAAETVSRAGPWMEDGQGLGSPCSGELRPPARTRSRPADVGVHRVDDLGHVCPLAE